mgnify:CR=1 FL=1
MATLRGTLRSYAAAAKRAERASQKHASRQILGVLC